MIGRRTFLQTAAFSAAASALPPPLLAASSMPLPPPIGAAERLQRIARAQARMKATGVAAVLVEAGPSLDYFTGVRWGRSERLTGVVIPAQGKPVVITPFFERPSVEQTLIIPADVRTWNEDEEPLKFVADAIREHGGASGKVGMEETNRYFLADRLAKQLPKAKIVSANPVVREVRMRKTPAELALMQAATDITIDAIRDVHGQLKPGMSAGDVSRLLSKAMTSRGGDDDWALVLFGPAAALPHGTREKQALKRGDVVLIDTGCAVHGYQSDISRTFVFDADPLPEVRKVWEQVAAGQKIAIQAARLGAAAGSVDDAVRAAYTRWGYGPGYKLPGLSHRTGHGIGMEGHEPVNLVHGETTPLAVGMCFSNEPGIYLPGKFGVRLEDCFHMTEAGPKFFSTPPASIDQPV